MWWAAVIAKLAVADPAAKAIVPTPVPFFWIANEAAAVAAVPAAP